MSLQEHRITLDGFKCRLPINPGGPMEKRVTMRLCDPVFVALSRAAMEAGTTPSTMAAAILRKHLTGGPLTIPVRAHEPPGSRRR